MGIYTIVPFVAYIVIDTRLILNIPLFFNPQMRRSFNNEKSGFCLGEGITMTTMND